MNPNNLQAIKNEQSGVEEVEEDIDLDAIYGGLDIELDDESYEPSEELKNSYSDIFKDIAKQGTKETLIGFGGTWGDLAELAGINPKLSERGKKKTAKEFETLGKLEDENYNPSFPELDDLQSDSLVPDEGRISTSGDLRGLNEMIGGPGDPETTAGKYAGRGGRILGSGLAFGQVNPVSSALAGGAGQGVEELGGGPIVQAATEIATLLLTQGKGNSKLSSPNKEVYNKINDLRKLGYADEEITLAINNASKGSKGGVRAIKSANSEKAFENFSQKSDAMVNDILGSEISGFEKGSKKVHELASDAYGKVVEDASKINLKNVDPFIDSVESTLKKVKKSYGNTKEAKEFTETLTQMGLDAIDNHNAEQLINFYQQLNKAGNWMNRSYKDRLLNEVKDSIKQTFKSEGKLGTKLAEDFERVNKGIQKAYKAEDVIDLVEKTKTQNGIDFNKFNKVFDKTENVKLFEDVLGTSQTENLKKISKVGKEVKDFDKSWKAANNINFGSKADLIRGGFGAYYLYNGDWEGLAKVAATKGGTAVVRKIAELSLTSPRFQNLMIKGLHAIKKESPRAMKSADEAMRKYLDEEGIDIDL